MSLSQKLSIHNSLHMLKRTSFRQTSKHIELLPNWQWPGIERLYHKYLRTNILLLFYILLLLWPSVMNVSSRLQSHGFIVSRFFYARIWTMFFQYLQKWLVEIISSKYVYKICKRKFSVDKIQLLDTHNKRHIYICNIFS